jgi:hypothetical protein
MQRVGEPYRGTLPRESDQAAAGGARLGAGADGARKIVRSGDTGTTRTSSRAGARVAVREAFGSAARPARMASEIERCAHATLSMRSRQEAASEASAGVGASPIKTAAHAAAIAPRIRSSVRPEPRLSSERVEPGYYSSRMNLRGLSATPLTRTS